MAQGGKRTKDTSEAGWKLCRPRIPAEAVPHTYGSCSWIQLWQGLYFSRRGGGGVGMRGIRWGEGEGGGPKGSERAERQYNTWLLRNDKLKFWGIPRGILN